MREIDRKVHLLKKYLGDKQNYLEDEELVSLFRQYPFLKDLWDELKTEEGLKSALQEYGVLSEGDAQNAEGRMWETVSKEIKDTREPKIRSLSAYWKYISAACVLLVALISFWIIKERQAHPSEQFMEIAAEFSPGSNKAVLQLADGQIIELSSDHHGVVVGETLSYDDGSLLTDALAEQQMDLVLSTPKGGQYQVTLSDGTKVWMNASSKLIYPNAFRGTKREVELEGEAYFEVVENKEKPFIVKTASETVEVLGTHFNVSAYQDEITSSVALLEGSVKVVLPNDFEKLIHPGQQAITQGFQMSVQEINTEEVVAWKNGEFMFNNEKLESVMRKLARWYDLEIEVLPSLRESSIWGSISRYDDFSKVLAVIQMTDENIRFKIEGRRVQVMK